jgi:hypothetical protein
LKKGTLLLILGVGLLAVRLAPSALSTPQAIWDPTIKSFLLLFFKKEALASLT